MKLDILKNLSKNFIGEITKAEKGEKSSLSFFQTKISKANIIKENSIFQSITIGGSHIEKSLVTLINNRISLINPDKKPLKNLNSKFQFLNFISKHLHPAVETICLSIAFPLKPVLRNDKMDGILIKSTKDHLLKGLIGLKLGQEIEEYLLKKFKKKVNVILVNDLVSLGISAKYNLSTICDNLVFGVLGTGTNLGFFKNNNSLINLESGNFNNFNQSKLGKEIDILSSNFGFQTFEKEISGKYLYKHYNLNKNTKNKIDNSEQLNQIISNKSENYKIALNIIKYSAELFASQIYGLYLYKSKKLKPKSDSNKIVFVIEGSLFWKGANYYKHFLNTIYRLGLNKDQISFVHLPKAGLKGCCYLA